MAVFKGAHTSRSAESTVTIVGYSTVHALENTFGNYFYALALRSGNALATRLKSRLAAGDRVKSLERIFKKQTPTAFFENLPLAIFLVRDDDPTF